MKDAPDKSLRTAYRLAEQYPLFLSRGHLQRSARGLCSKRLVVGAEAGDRVGGGLAQQHLPVRGIPEPHESVPIVADDPITGVIEGEADAAAGLVALPGGYQKVSGLGFPEMDLTLGAAGCACQAMAARVPGDGAHRRGMPQPDQA